MAPCGGEGERRKEKGEGRREKGKGEIEERKQQEKKRNSNQQHAADSRIRCVRKGERRRRRAKE